MAEDIVPIEEQLDAVMRKHGTWENYKESFVRLSDQQRAYELHIFDKSLNEEIARPTKTYADYVQCRRELGDLDNLLRSAKR
jgi:hypothetical protein